MKKMFALVMALLLLVSNAFAQSLFPPLDTTSTVPGTDNALAPSYSVYAGVEPNAISDDVIDIAKVDGNPSYLRQYTDVSAEMYYEYGTYLAERGCQLVAQDTVEFSGYNWAKLTIEKGEITFCVWYDPLRGLLCEFYPYYVECEKLDPLRDYIEVQKNSSFKLGSNAKLTVKSMDYYSYTLEVNPSITLNVQNLTNKMLFTDGMCNINLHVFAGNDHFTFKVRSYGEIWRTRQGRYALKGGTYWKSMESGECTFAFDTTQADILNLEPDKMAITFEYGSYKYVYYVK